MDKISLQNNFSSNRQFLKPTSTTQYRVLDDRLSTFGEPQADEQVILQNVGIKIKRTTQNLVINIFRCSLTSEQPYSLLCKSDFFY